jgi:Homeobox KN domain
MDLDIPLIPVPNPGLDIIRNTSNDANGYGRQDNKTDEMTEGFLKILESKKKDRRVSHCSGADRHTATTTESKETKPQRSSYQRRKPRLPLKAVLILDDWFELHKNKPYPTEEEKSQLMLITGLNRNQVNNWFMNARKRRLSQQGPFDAWLSGPSESEGVSEEDIARAANDFSPPLVPFHHRPRRPKSFCSSASSDTPAFDHYLDTRRQRPRRQGRRTLHWTRHSSVSSTNVGSEMDRFSSREALSIPENISIDELPMVAIEPKPKPKPSTKFECTFCRAKLNPKSWKRHEESHHLPRREWTCLADGKFMQDDGTCAFCRKLISPSEVFYHPEQCCHRIGECMNKSLNQRSFYRREHILQHIRGFHTSSLSSRMLSEWESSKNEAERFWKCGFCGEDIFGWDARATHIAAHFRKGLDMSTWRSEWITTVLDPTCNSVVDQTDPTEAEEIPIFWEDL